MRLWLKGHGFEPEATPPSTQRTFDYGDAIEWLLFDKLTIPSSHDESGFKTIGDWWNTTEVLKEPKLGLHFYPDHSPIQSRQMEVEIGGFKGHIDGWASIQLIAGDHDEDTEAKPTVVDSKSANTWSYKRAKFEDLEADIFAREYVISQNCYVAGVRKLGLPADRSVLTYVNKEIGQMMFRLIKYNPEYVDEGMERLAWASSPAEPRPDHEWKSGSNIPLRCRYCEQKLNCSLVRGQAITGPTFTKDGKPEWKVA